ncbi:MAG TPA: replication endonuclease, partial [Nitrococcus sp.]|nr:replication endonuclease [Nitrococcus sp.]
TSAADRIPDRLSRRWVGHQLSQLPGDWSEHMAQGWRQRWQEGKGHDGDRRREANTFIRETLEQLRAGSDLPLTANEDHIRARARVRARRYQSMRSLITPQYAESLVEETGAITPEGAIERLCLDQWWLRRLRKAHGRVVERAGIQAGVVRSSRQIYVTDSGVGRRRQQKRRNRNMLEEMLAVNELDEELSLAAIVDASVSNPKLRRGELMCRMAGMEWVADAIGWRGWFLTLTAPSAYHATRSYGRRSKRITDNPSYEGFTPREAQAWLCKIWSRIRAAVKRRGIEWFGFRVAEPHGDGTPHWHLLMFWEPEHTETILRIFRGRALAEYGDEKGARSYRFQAKKIDARRGSAAGYIAKYVAKNIDGACMDANDMASGNDLFGRDPIALAERVDAWASAWGIRQFQQIGGPSVSCWRELRRLRGEEQEGQIELLRAAADAGNWGVFMHTIRELTGNPSLVKLSAVDQGTGECAVNRYGEPAPGRVIGVRLGDSACLTRTNIWSIRRKDSAAVTRPGPGYVRPKWVGVVHGKRVVGEYGGSRCFKRAARGRAPWSPVNNCTGVASDGAIRRGRGASRAPAGVPEPLPKGERGFISRSKVGARGAPVDPANHKHRAIAGNRKLGAANSGTEGG